MHRHLPLVLTAALLVAFRVVGILFPLALPNFQPLAALFFCGALMAPGWRGFALPLVIWAVTFPFGIGPIYSLSLFATTLLALVVTFFLGKVLVQKGFVPLLAGSLVAAIVFHLITNTAAWLVDPMYEKSLTGFWQSIWTGPPGSSLPSWIFLRNFAAANVLFTAVFALPQTRAPKAVPASTALATD